MLIPNYNASMQAYRYSYKLLFKIRKLYLSSCFSQVIVLYLHFKKLTYCRRLLLVPLTSFHKMADLVGDPASPLVFLANTSRCGSTLLTQMLEFTGQCVTISEPDFIHCLAHRYLECEGQETEQVFYGCVCERVM